MSDILARNVFKDRKACEYVLRIIMDDEARMDEKKDVAYSLADRKMSVEDISEIIKVNIETVIAYKKDGVKHHFLDNYDL